MEVATVTVNLPALKRDEDDFCLAMLEYGGNLAAAYNAVYAIGEVTDPDTGEIRPAVIRNAGSRARALLGRPEVAARIRQLQEVVQQDAYISLGSHLDQLAQLRDLSVKTGDMKSALSAEKARGEVAGYYAGKGAGSKSTDPNERAPSVTINMNGTTATIADWSAKHGTGAPLIIDMKG